MDEINGYTYTALAKVVLYDGENHYTYHMMYAHIHDYREAMNEVLKDFDGDEVEAVSITLVDAISTVTHAVGERLCEGEISEKNKTSDLYDMF